MPDPMVEPMRTADVLHTERLRGSDPTGRSTSGSSFPANSPACGASEDPTPGSPSTIIDPGPHQHSRQTADAPCGLAQLPHLHGNALHAKPFEKGL